MVDDFLTYNWNVTHDFLDTLVDSRLLRKELRLDDYYYEISHDTLLPAIIESRDKRRRSPNRPTRKKRSSKPSWPKKPGNAPPWKTNYGR